MLRTRDASALPLTMAPDLSVFTIAMFSLMGRMRNSPSSWRFSVIMLIPLEMARRGLSEVISRPFRTSRPLSAFWAPKSRLASSVRPEPTRPPIPKISPSRTSKLTCFTASPHVKSDAVSTVWPIVVRLFW
jgi:hypothetical protein